MIDRLDVWHELRANGTSSTRQLAERFGRSERQIRRRISQLIRDGYVVDDSEEFGRFGAHRVYRALPLSALEAPSEAL